MRKVAKKSFDEIQILKVQLVRSLADYDNLRKRTESEKGLWIKFSTERVLIKLLPVIDALESALKHTQDSGLAIAVSEFKKVLAEEGIEEVIPKKNEVFNPEFAEAVESVEGGKKDHVAELVLAGWKFSGLPAQAGGKIIRPAKVKVFGEKSKIEPVRNASQSDVGGEELEKEI